MRNVMQTVAATEATEATAADKLSNLATPGSATVKAQINCPIAQSFLSDLDIKNNTKIT